MGEGISRNGERLSRDTLLHVVFTPQRVQFVICLGLVRDGPRGREQLPTLTSGESVFSSKRASRNSLILPNSFEYLPSIQGCRV